MPLDFIAVIVGGEGPDVWDKEVEISAGDIVDALNLAQGRAEKLDGTVVSIEQQ